MAILGAIRWDAWYSSAQGSLSDAEQVKFSVAGFQSRAPWFSHVSSPYKVTSIGTQANIDTECQMAATAGLDYFAFTCYQPGALAFSSTELSTAWNYYQASPNKNLIDWCWITGPNHWLSATFADNTWKPFLANMAANHCTQANYQKVLTNRPLVFIFAVTSAYNTTNLAAAITYFRAQCVAAGLGSPYIVMQTDENSYSTVQTRATAIGADAVSNYALPTLYEFPTPSPGDYATLTGSMSATWVSQAALGKVIPCGCTGWDVRCRIRVQQPFTAGQWGWFGDLSYWNNPTTAQVASHVSDLMAFLAANTSACEAQAALIYSWTECTEGSVRALIPTLGDPPVAGGTNLLNAIKAVLRP